MLSILFGIARGKGQSSIIQYDWQFGVIPIIQPSIALVADTCYTRPGCFPSTLLTNIFDDTLLFTDSDRLVLPISYFFVWICKNFIQTFCLFLGTVTIYHHRSEYAGNLVIYPGKKRQNITKNVK